MKILFQKFVVSGERKGENCEAWEKLFDNVEQLLEYMNEWQDYLLGDDYEIRIREIPSYKKGE